MLCYLMLLETAEAKALFQRIYDKLRHRMYRVALSLLRSDALAQEAVQESFFKVVKKFSKISQLSAEEITPYIVTIVENAAKDMLRKEGRLTDLPENFDLPATENAESQSAYHRLVSLIAALPEQYRHILHLKFVEEERDGEIAKRLGLSVSQVSNRVSRGRTLLQEQLRKEGYHDE